MENQLIRTALKIKYAKVHFHLRFVNDCRLPMNKVSALRGGIGEMLLRSNCIADRACEQCEFERECMVQRIMYSRYDITPARLSVGEKDSIGYVIECENYETDFCAGDELEFCLILFGKTIVYFNQYLLALYSLGQDGIGKEHAQFVVAAVTNEFRQPILEDNNIFMGNYKHRTLLDYVNYRLKSVDIDAKKIVFKTPVTIKFQKEFMQEFDENGIVNALLRRIYMLDCFEGIEVDLLHDYEACVPAIVRSEKRPIDVRRYSSRKDSQMVLKGIKGSIEFDEIDEELLWLLLAAEITHIGKNTSFGFGRLRVE